MSALTTRGSTRRWRRVRVYVLLRDGERCQVPDELGRLCLAPAMVAGPLAGHVDHIIPRSQGGTDDPANLRAACEPCNLRRGAGRQPVAVTTRWSWSW